MNNNIVIRAERADCPQAAVVLGALDAYLAWLYEPEANHILSIAELLAPEVKFFAAGQRDRMASEPDTVGYADNGLSLFFEKRL